MYEIFEKLLKSRNVKVSDVSKMTGIRSGVFSDWKAGRYTPKTDKLQKIADYFGVSLEYLTTGEDTEKTPYYLNDETREIAQFLYDHPDHRILFDASRKMSPEDVRAIMNLIERFTNS